MEFEDVLSNQPVVIDNVSAAEKSINYMNNNIIQGSGVVKAGFAGDDQPKTFFPSWYGRVPLQQSTSD